MKKSIFLSSALFVSLCFGCSSSNELSKYKDVEQGVCYLLDDANSRICLGLDDEHERVTSMNVIISYDTNLIGNILNTEQEEDIDTFYNDMIVKNLSYRKVDLEDGIKDFWDVAKVDIPNHSSHFDEISEQIKATNHYYQEVVDFRFYNDDFNYEDKIIQERFQRYGMQDTYDEERNAISYEKLLKDKNFVYHYVFELGRKAEVPKEFTPSF